MDVVPHQLWVGLPNLGLKNADVVAIRTHQLPICPQIHLFKPPCQLLKGFGLTFLHIDWVRTKMQKFLVFITHPSSFRLAFER